MQTLLKKPSKLVSVSERNLQTAALRLLQYVRDEAHRFAQHYHHMLTWKRVAEE